MLRKASQDDFAFYETRVKELLVSQQRKDMLAKVHQRQYRVLSLWAKARHLLLRLRSVVYEPVAYFRYSPRIVTMVRREC